MDQVNANHDQEIIATRDNIEELWDSSLNLRERKKVAVRTTPGFSMGGDNVGMLSKDRKKKPYCIVSLVWSQPNNNQPQPQQQNNQNSSWVETK